MHCLCLIVANSFLPIEPYESQQKKRCLFLKQEKKFVDKPADEIVNKETELPMNKNFLEAIEGEQALIHQPAYQRLYVLVLVRAFHRWYQEKGKQSPGGWKDVPSSFTTNYSDFFDSDATQSPMEVFLQHFEITQSDDHLVPGWKLEEFIS